MDLKKNFVKYLPFLIIIILSLVIFKQLFLPGYILQWDLAAGPNNFLPADVYKESYPGNTVPSILFFKFLYLILPNFIVQKSAIIAVPLISFVCMYFFLKKNNQSRFASYFGAILYGFNPFVFMRLSAGYMNFLFGYSLLPLLLYFSEKSLKKPNIKNLILLVLISWIVVSFSLHVMVIFFLLYLIHSLISKKDEIIKNLVVFGKFTLLFFATNVYWIIPLFFKGSQNILQNLGIKDLFSFSPLFYNYFEIIKMEAFWRIQFFNVPIFLNFIFLVMFFFFIYGMVTLYRNSKKDFIFFLILFVLGLLLIPGMNGFLGSFIKTFEKLFIAFRDFSKFTILLIIGYVVAGSYGVSRFIHESKNKNLIKAIILMFVFVYVIVYGLTIIDFSPVDYPQEWVELNEFLSNDTEDFQTLFFPWHLYMDYKWIPAKTKRSINLAPFFFNKNPVFGKNIEIDSIYTEIKTSEQALVDNLLSSREEEDLENVMNELNIKYVVLLKESDYESYSFLFNSSSLLLKNETDYYYVWINKKW